MSSAGGRAGSRNAHLDNTVGHVQTRDECVKEKDQDDSRFINQESQRNGECDQPSVTA